MQPTTEQQDILSKARRTIQTFFPYFSTLVLRMEHEFSEEIPTAAVYPNGHTVWGTAFFDELVKTDGTAGVSWVMLHELLHLVMKHGQVAERMAVSGNYFPEIGNVAMDIAINQIIRETLANNSTPTIWTIKQPTNVQPVYETTFGFEPNLRFVDYYRLLMDKAEKRMKNGETGALGGDKPGEGCGVQKGGSQNRPTDCTGPSTPISSGDLKVEVAACAQKARKAAERSRGSVACGVLQIADDILEPPKVPWNEVLRSRIFHEVSRGHGEYVTYNYPNKRQAGLDYFVGTLAPRLSSTLTTNPKVGVLADTSGSMCSDLHKVVREAAAIIYEINAPVVFAACDTQVHFCDTVSNVLDIKSALKGGGGTAMQSGLEALAKKGCNPIVCITDGYIEMTKQPSTGAHVIWCIVTEYTEAVKHAESENWGTVIICKE